MKGTISLFRKEDLTLRDVTNPATDSNLLQRIEYSEHDEQQFDYLWKHRHTIEAIICKHLKLSRHDICRVRETSEWLNGYFNICTMVEVVANGTKRCVVFRTPMSHRLTGIVDEKMRSEIGAYVWIQTMCSDIPIPDLIGFGLSNGQHYSHSKHQSILKQLNRHMRRVIHSALNRPLLSQYINISNMPVLGMPYLLMEHIGEDYVCLFDELPNHTDDELWKNRLMAGLARITLSLARIPQPRIGSFQFHDDATVSLSNRYLSSTVAIFENSGTKQIIKPGQTHSCTDAFVSDLITTHLEFFLAAPNLCAEEYEGHRRLATINVLRAVANQHTKSELRNGPFFLSLTELNADNIFVDREGNVAGLVDLEWLCSMPAEALSEPYWLTAKSTHDFIYNPACQEQHEITRDRYLDILQQQELLVQKPHTISMCDLMSDSWKSKRAWFWLCLNHHDVRDVIVSDHLCPPDSFNIIAEDMAQIECSNADTVISDKIADYEAYTKTLLTYFEY